MSPSPATKGTLAGANQSFFVYVKDKNTGQIERLAFTGDIQIGLPGNPAELQLLGRLSLNAVSYDTTIANNGVIYAADNDTIVGINMVTVPRASQVTCYLPKAPRDGEIVFVKDLSGTAGTVSIIVFPNPASDDATIDGQPSQTLSTDYSSLALFWLSGNWHVLVIGGSGSGTTIPAPAYYGFITSSLWWQQQSIWEPFMSAAPDNMMVDVITQSIFRTQSSFVLSQGGLYWFHANFNSYGSDAYISLRLSSSINGIALERSTYRTDPSDQNQVQLNGIFSSSFNDVWALQYITSGTTFAWTGSNPMVTGENMHTGEVAISLVSELKGRSTTISPFTITGEGGTTVTLVGTNYIVSSSIGGGSGSSFTVTGSGEVSVTLTGSTYNVFAPLDGWQTAFDVDYTNNGSLTFNGDGLYTIGGIVHQLTNSISASSSPGGTFPSNFTMSPGTGIVMSPGTDTWFVGGNASSRGSKYGSAPRFRVNLSNNIPNFDLRTPLRIWLRKARTNNTSFGQAFGNISIAAEYTTDWTLAPFNGSAGGPFPSQIVWASSFEEGWYNIGGSNFWGSTAIDMQLNKITNQSPRGGAQGNISMVIYDVLVLDYPNGIMDDDVIAMVGNMTGSTWPSVSNLHAMDHFPGTHADFSQIMFSSLSVVSTPWTTSQHYASFAANCNSVTQGTGAGQANFTATFKRFRVDYYNQS